MNDKTKAFLLQVTIGALEAVWQKERPESNRETRLARAKSRVAVLVDEYRRERWHKTELEKANSLLEEFDVRIEEMPADGIWDDHTMLHIGLSSFEAVRAAEVSWFRRSRLDKGIDRLLELLEPWDIEALPVARGVEVGRLGDRFTIRAMEAFV